MFALGWLRLAQSRGWRGSSPDVLPQEGAWEHVASLAGRLSPRERVIVRAQRSLHGADSIPVDSLRAYAARHPDDAEAWYILGERLYHLGARESQAASRPAFERAIALQPRFVPYHIHAIDVAFQVEPDSAEARRTVERLENVAPESPHARLGRIAYGLAVGTDEARNAAMTALPELPLAAHLYLLGRLSHPELGPTQGRVAAAVAERPDLPPGFRDQFFWSGTRRLTSVGRLARAIELSGEIESPDGRYCSAAGAFLMVDLMADRVPDALFGPMFAPERGREALAALPTAPERLFSWLMGSSCARAAARLAGREEEAVAWAAVRDSFLAAVPVEERIGAEAAISDVDEVAAAYAGLRDDDPETALARFEQTRFFEIATEDFILLRARLLLALGRPARALEILERLGRSPLAELERARALEALGRDAEARAAYAWFLRQWTPDVPGLQALTDSATAGLARIQTRLN
ncbi:MAG: hypothetical protein R6X22_00195 [Gemmatimonadota bacterium]